MGTPGQTAAYSSLEVFTSAIFLFLDPAFTILNQPLPVIARRTLGRRGDPVEFSVRVVPK